MNEVKKHGPLTAASLIVGIVVGVGIFFKLGSIMTAVEGKEHLAVIAWIIGAILVILSAVSVAGLASQTSENGGLQNYIEKTMGSTLAYVVGFFQTFVFFPALLSGIAYYGSVFTGAVVGYEDLLTTMLVTVAYILVFGAANIFSNSGAIVQKVATCVKLIPILLIIFIGAFLSGDYQPNLAGIPVFESTGASDFSLIGAALIPILFAFDGWIIVTTMSDEIKNSKKVLPIAIVAGIGFISVLYILFTVGLINLGSGNAFASGQFGISDVFANILGDNGAKVLNGFIAISALGVLNGLCLAGFRSPSAFLKKFDLPIITESVKEKFHKSLLFSGLTIIIIGLIYLSVPIIMENIEPGSLGKFIDLLTDGPVTFMWIMYIILFIGIAIEVINKKLDIHIGFAITSIISAVMGIYAVLSTLQNNPLYTSITLIIVIISVALATKAEKKSI